MCLFVEKLLFVNKLSKSTKKEFYSMNIPSLVTTQKVTNCHISEIELSNLEEKKTKFGSVFPKLGVS